jgi:hypothetical protein
VDRVLVQALAIEHGWRVERHHGVWVLLDDAGRVRAGGLSAPFAKSSTSVSEGVLGLLRTAAREVHSSLRRSPKRSARAPATLWAFDDPSNPVVGAVRTDFSCATCGEPPIGQFADLSPRYGCSSRHDAGRAGAAAVTAEITLPPESVG